MTLKTMTGPGRNRTRRNTADQPPDFSSIIGNIELGICIFDHGCSRVVYMNSAASRMLNNAGLVNRLIESVKRETGDYFREIGLEDGSSLGYSIYPADAAISFILVNEISYRKLMVETGERKLLFEKLAVMSSEIAHEIGNPLTSVKMTLQVLLGNMAHWSLNKQKEYIQTSIGELERLSAFLNKIRAYSFNGTLEIGSGDLDEIVNRTLRRTAAVLRKKKIAVKTRIPRGVRVRIDEDAFIQVLFNLIQNSVDALPRGGNIRLAVEKGHPVSEYFVKLVYSNDGPAIPDEIMNRIFQPLFSTKESSRGRGLDMALKLMTRMGGTIRAVPPDKGWGVRFVLYIPVGAEQLEQEN